MESENMTIQRAREILGTEIVNLSDQEVTNLIYSTGQFADTLLDVVVNTFTANPGGLIKENRKANNEDTN